MKLYYTTTVGPNEAQPTPINSIGGYKSSTPVTNDVFGNLFSDLSLYGMKAGQAEYKAMILVNELSVPVNNLEFWFQSEEDVMYCDYQLAVVTLATDEEGNSVMEKSPNYLSKPFYATFYSATPEDKVSIETILAPGEQLGLWVCRKIDKATVLEDYNKVAEPDPERQARYKRVAKAQEEAIEFNISWLP